MRISIATAALAAASLTACGPPASTDPCKNRKAGDLVLTELMIDPDSTDTGNEWFEVFNTTSAAIDLKGLTLFMREASGTTKTHSIRAGSIPSRGFFTFGDVRSGPNPAWINYAYADALTDLPNSAGTVGVRCGTVAIGEVTYTKPARASRSRMLNGASGGVPVDPDATAAADEARWCDTPAGTLYSATNAGTPGTVNPECQPEATTGTCIDPGTGGVRPISSPAEGDLLITEVLARPSTREATQEWFEVLAVNSVDLNDLTVSSATASDKLTAAACLRVNAGQYALVARSADTFVNGDLPPPLVTTTLSIANTNERLTISKGDAGIDMAAFVNSASGIAWQLDPLKLDIASNDDPNNFCRATTKWNPDGGGDYGTPAAANTACPDSDGGTDGGGGGTDCFDVGLGATRPIVRPVVGDVVMTEVMSDPSIAGDTVGEWFEALVRTDVDLNGVTLANEGTGQTAITSTNCLRVAAGTYALFARSADPAVNGGLPQVTATFAFDLSNSPTGGVAQSRAVRMLSQSVELDRLAYPLTAGTCPSAACPAGTSLQLDAGLTSPADNDVAANLCVTPATQRFTLADGGLGERGTPGAANVGCP